MSFVDLVNSYKLYVKTLDIILVMLNIYFKSENF